MVKVYQPKRQFDSNFEKSNPDSDLENKDAGNAEVRVENNFAESTYSHDVIEVEWKYLEKNVENNVAIQDQNLFAVRKMGK